LELEVKQEAGVKGLEPEVVVKEVKVKDEVDVEVEEEEVEVEVKVRTEASKEVDVKEVSGGSKGGGGSGGGGGWTLGGYDKDEEMQVDNEEAEAEPLEAVEVEAEAVRAEPVEADAELVEAEPVPVEVEVGPVEAMEAEPAKPAEPGEPMPVPAEAEVVEAEAVKAEPAEAVQVEPVPAEANSDWSLEDLERRLMSDPSGGVDEHGDVLDDSKGDPHVGCGRITIADLLDVMNGAPDTAFGAERTLHRERVSVLLAEEGVMRHSLESVGVVNPFEDLDAPLDLGL